MKKKTYSSKPTDKKEKDDLPGYPIYPAGEDIYSKEEEDDMDPIDLEEDEMELGLDVPGSELDDDEEKIGSEDEENNYYSLGGDDHDNLEEDQGE